MPADNEAQFDELNSDDEEKVGEPTNSDDELYAFSLYSNLFGSYIVSYSVVAAEVKDQNSEEENEIDEDARKAEKPEVADYLSVMYPPCQDPMLVKIYKGLPALP